MESTLQAYERAFRDALAGWEELVSPLDNVAFNRAPAPGRWSVGQCMDHLNVTAEPYIAEFETALERGGPPGKGPFKYDLRGRIFIWSTGPQVRIPFRSPAKMAPRSGPFDLANSLARYREHTARFVSIVRRSEGLDLSVMRVRSPFLPRLPFFTYPMGALLESVAGHEHRHLLQARRAVGEA